MQVVKLILHKKTIKNRYGYRFSKICKNLIILSKSRKKKIKLELLNYARKNTINA